MEVHPEPRKRKNNLEKSNEVTELEENSYIEKSKNSLNEKIVSKIISCLLSIPIR